MLDKFANAAAEYLQNDPDCGDFAECHAIALDDPDATWNYLWWLNTEDSRAICMEYSSVIY